MRWSSVRLWSWPNWATDRPPLALITPPFHTSVTLARYLRVRSASELTPLCADIFYALFAAGAAIPQELTQ